MYGRPKIALFALRLALGWIFLYSGLSKILDGDWSARGYLLNAQTFSDFYAWFASPANLTWVNFLVEWGEVAIGLALILGVFVPIASACGMLMLALFYFPDLRFPYIGEHGFLIDERIVYICLLWLLLRLRAGSFWAVGGFRGGWL